MWLVLNFAILYDLAVLFAVMLEKGLYVRIRCRAMQMLFVMQYFTYTNRVLESGDRFEALRRHRKRKALHD